METIDEETIAAAKDSSSGKPKQANPSFAGGTANLHKKGLEN